MSQPLSGPDQKLPESICRPRDPEVTTSPDGQGGSLIFHCLSPSTNQKRSGYGEIPKAKRRLPTAKGRRTKISCDSCRTRRRKCQRPEYTGWKDEVQRVSEEEPVGPCKSCLEAGLLCKVTLPRMHRFSGDAKNFSRRYEALMGIVQGLYPQLGSEPTAEELALFGQERGVAMPDGGLEQHSRQQPFHSTLPYSTTALPSVRGTVPEVANESTALVRDGCGIANSVDPSRSFPFISRLRTLITNRLMPLDLNLSNEKPRYSSRPADVTTVGSLYQHCDLGRLLFNPGGFVPHQSQNRRGSTISELARECSGDRGAVCRLPHCVSAHQVELPCREDSESCIEAFFHYLHPDFLLFHRPTFQMVDEEIWDAVETSRGEQGSEISTGWLGCLYMIYALGSRFLAQDEKWSTFQHQWFTKTKGLATQCVPLSLPSVCALMLQSLYLTYQNDHTTAWIYHGSACQCAMALWMHRQDVSATFHPFTRELRKRVWWTLYIHEQSLGYDLGHPTAMDDGEVSVAFPDENILECAYGQPPKLVEWSSQLWHLFGCIRRDECNQPAGPVGRYSQVVQHLRRLLSWRASVPLELFFNTAHASGANDATWRASMLLRVTYQCALGLLTRNSLLRTITASKQHQGLGMDAYIIGQLGKICVTSAMRTVDLLVELWRGGHFQKTFWLDAHSAFVANMEIELRLVAPDSGLLSRDPCEKHWRPWESEPSETQDDALATESRTDLDHDLEFLITRNHLTECYSMTSLEDAVSKVHNIQGMS